ncbi:hypothetical protein [Streptomyces niveus]|uniref:hypothetical protein n=1 Tax=Streptomyces niveus TaxID=193462 RepID=UPI00341F51DC
MSLDMTGMASIKTDVHWRRYLSIDGRIIVIPMQAHDYVSGWQEWRFVDLQAFPTEAEARFTPLRREDVIEAASQASQEPGDDVVIAGQKKRLLDAIDANHGSVS